MSFKAFAITTIVSIVTFSAGIAVQAQLEIIGPQSYEDCVICGAKDATDKYAIYEIKKACREKFPELTTRDLLPTSKELPGSVVKMIKVKGSPSGNFDSSSTSEDDPFADFFKGYDGIGNFDGTVYNGDREWTLTSIILKLEDIRSKTSTEYEAKVVVRPLQSETYEIKVFEMPERYSLSVISAKGCKE